MSAANPPIPGEVIDPPPKAIPEVVQELEAGDDAKAAFVGVGFAALTRFLRSKATLLAAGTTYYVFLASFSLIALGYGITAFLGSDQLAAFLTEAIAEAFPGLLGEEGIDPAELRAIGQTAGIVGLVAMLYAGGGAMAAASSSLHLIYGAPPDPRNFVLGRIRLLGWVLVVGPLIAASFVVSTVAARFGDRILGAIGLDGVVNSVVLVVVAVGVTLAVDVAVVYLMLANLGGIRPARPPLIVGSVVGAVLIQLIRIPMGLVLEVSLDKPQYGAFAVPIGILLVLYLNSLVLYAAAALTAGLAEQARGPLTDVG